MTCLAPHHVPRPMERYLTQPHALGGARHTAPAGPAKPSPAVTQHTHTTGSHSCTLLEGNRPNQRSGCVAAYVHSASHPR